MERTFPSHIRVSVIPLQSVVKITKNQNGEDFLLGADGQLLNILSHFLKFKYSVLIPPDRQWGKQTPDGNFTGMVGQVYNGEADFSMTWTSITKERARGVDFSEPYAMNELTFVTNMPGFLPKAYVFFYPFDIFTWISIMLTVLVIPFLFLLLMPKGPSYLERLLYVFGTITHQALNNEDYYHRLLLFFWWITSTVLSMSYTGAVSSFLSVPLQETPMRDFKQLATATTSGKYRCLDVKGSVIYSAFNESGKEVLVRLAENIDKNNWFTSFAYSQTEDFFDGKTAFFGSRLFLYLRFGKPPFNRRYVSEDAEIAIPIALGIRKDFCCLKTINLMLRRIKYGGIYQKILDDETFKRWLDFTRTFKTPEHDVPLSIQDIYGAFLILVIGNTLAIFIFIVECSWKRKANKDVHNGHKLISIDNV